MPGRVSRSSLPSAGASSSKKATKKRKQRSLNAFAIAQHQVPERTKIKRHRLGETEDDGPRRKRQRVTDDGEDDDEPGSSDERQPQRKNAGKTQAGDLDIESGSDSEGHEWRLGVVDQDGDSDLDSEEAFGESDEERFEGFSFRGSSGIKNRSNAKRSYVRSTALTNDVNLNEGEEQLEEDDDEDGLGEDAVDLATMLDGSDASDEDEDSVGKRKDVQTSRSIGIHSTASEGYHVNGDDFNGFAQDSIASGEDGVDDDDEDGPSEYSDDEEASDFSVSDAETDDNNPEKLKQLRDVVASLAKERNNDNENDNTNTGVMDSAADAARMLSALKGMTGLDPALTRSVRKLASNLGASKSDKTNGLVKVPLPKRQQDRIDRSVAYQKAKETLNRWIDTVKHNRRAEHLSFPLQDPHAQEAQGTTRLLPTSAGKPQTELESTILNILQASGLGGSGGKSEEEQIRGFEELEANKLPYEEVVARRAELRKARELLFREEVRSRRIKKIKSKAYRRVHRKEAQRAAQKERDLLTAAGVDLSEDEKEANDRRRAEERMGARHRESKWAKSVKQTGRGGWDEDARDAVTDMARRNEELRRRMEGKTVRNEDDSASGTSDLSDDDDMSGEDDEEAGGFRLRRQLVKVQIEGAADATKSTLGQMKFMQRADAARRQQNDEDAERVRRELDGEESPSEEEAETTIGRKIFGPTEISAAKRPRNVRAELEEGHSSGSEDGDQTEPDRGTAGDANPSSPRGETKSVPRTKPTLKELPKPLAKANAFISQPPEPVMTRSVSPTEADDVPRQTTTHYQPKAATAPPNTTGWTTIAYPSSTRDADNDDDDDSASNHSAADSPIISSNLELVRAAFGGDDTAASFAAEKADAAASEDEKMTDNALPGWGSWTGAGISKREQKRIDQRNKGRFVTKEAGVKPSNRKDYKLKDVIISERRIKKNSKYLAERLPHPFETRQQYERSLRIPVGPEWTTKETFQAATKPRVLVKAGRIIAPMSEPMV